MTVEERLRDSKRESGKQDFEAGAKAGRDWAENDADVADIEALIADASDRFSDIGEIAKYLETDSECLVGELGGRESSSRLFAHGFVTGVENVVHEHPTIFAL
jgi:hypothetical protein